MQNNFYEGQVFQCKFEITEDVYENFKTTFCDFNPLHTDDEYARSKGFNSKVMHGNILCGFISRFVGELLPQKNTVIHSVDIKFRKPCYLNDVVILNAEIIEIYESISTYIINFSFTSASVVNATGTLQIGLLL